MSKDMANIGRSNVRRSKSHERRIAHLLTAWSGVPFRRRRVEGRDSAVRIVELVADVIPCAGDFHFSIEAKCGKDFSLDGLLANPLKSLFTEWWHQACYDAQLVTGDLKRTILPLMFFKPHPNWDWVAISAKAIGVLRPRSGKADGWWFPHLVFDAFCKLGKIECNVSHSPKHKKIVGIDLDPVMICRWRDFAAHVHPGSAFARAPTTAELASLIDGD